MKPPETIEILTSASNQFNIVGEGNFRDAIKQGIEALKRVDDQRNGKVVPYEQWLPGETEE